MENGDPTMPYSVPEFLEALLEAADITQTTFAKAVKVSQGTISKWKTGIHDPRKTEWDRVLDYAKKNPKTRRLVDEAPELSLDALIDPHGQTAKAQARIILEAFIKTLAP